MSDLARKCVFCGRPRFHPDGRMLDLKGCIPEKVNGEVVNYPVISVCWSCLDRPIRDLAPSMQVTGVPYAEASQ